MKALVEDNKIVCLSEVCTVECPHYKTCIEITDYDVKTINQAVLYNISRMQNTMWF